MVRSFAFDNGYGDPVNTNEGSRARTNSTGDQPEIIRKLSAMFDDLKDMFGDRQNTAHNTNATPPSAAHQQDPVPEGKFTGSRTVHIEGVGALTATVSAQFHSRTRCTFKIKCYDPGILQQRINTTPQASRAIHKIGSFKDHYFNVQGGEWITLPFLQQGQKQGAMAFNCRLSSLKWDAVQQSIAVSVGKEDEYTLSPKLSNLLAELFSEEIVLSTGTCDEVAAFNSWLLRVHQDIEAHSRTRRMAP
jgi:hypothetical protein